MSVKFFIFGAGYSGIAIAREVIKAGADVAGTTRTTEKFAALEKAGIRPFVFDGALTAEIEAELATTTHLVISIAPGERDPVLAAARDTIVQQMPALRWIGYLSTVGVYGDHDGAWVDETTPDKPESKRSVERAAAEGAWADLGRGADVPVAILRLAGIYGPGRNAFVNLEAGNARRIVKPGQVFNRIHVADIAGSALHLAMRNLGGIFNVTDDEPCPPPDVVSYAADLMGVEAPAEVAFDDADMSPMARSFYGENKRVSNARLKQAGYAFRYPDYRAAFSAMWADGSWRGTND
jgi:nucleoside-diphosphate-sugar epimerase